MICHMHRSRFADESARLCVRRALLFRLDEAIKAGSPPLAGLPNTRAAMEEVKRRRKKEHEAAHYLEKRLARFRSAPEYVQTVAEEKADLEADAALHALDQAVEVEADGLRRANLMAMRFITTDWVRASCCLPRAQRPADLV